LAPFPGFLLAVAWGIFGEPAGLNEAVEVGVLVGNLFKKIKCLFGWCLGTPASNEKEVWGQCVDCDKRFGVTSRESIRKYLENEENEKWLNQLK